MKFFVLLSLKFALVQSKTLMAVFWLPAKNSSVPKTDVKNPTWMTLTIIVQLCWLQSILISVYVCFNSLSLSWLLCPGNAQMCSMGKLCFKSHSNSDLDKQREQNNIIEKELNKLNKEYKKTHRLLLLGAGRDWTFWWFFVLKSYFWPENTDIQWPIKFRPPFWTFNCSF